LTYICWWCNVDDNRSYTLKMTLTV
jgi:hypothetical protein